VQALKNGVDWTVRIAVQRLLKWTVLMIVSLTPAALSTWEVIVQGLQKNIMEIRNQSFVESLSSVPIYMLLSRCFLYS